jgi:hypothetical protein
LDTAEKALVGMKQAKSLAEFEAEWRVLLNSLEKAWLKCERGCQHVRQFFEPWQAHYHRLRKKDMLLRYLKQARDADNHSIQDITKLEPGRRSFKFARPGTGHIKRMIIDTGRVMSYEGDPMIVEDTPPHPVAVPIRNNGEWFNPPTSHLGAPINDAQPVMLAELGIKFYTEFIHEAERKFFPPAP